MEINKKRWITAMVFLAAVILGCTLMLTRKDQNQFHPKVILESASKNSNEDLQKGVKLIEKEIAKWPEVDAITKIEFLEDGNDEILQWLNKLGKDQSEHQEYSDSMTYRVSFHTKKDIGNSSLNPDTEYDYQFYIAKNQPGKWEVVEGAYGMG